MREPRDAGMLMMSYFMVEIDSGEPLPDIVVLPPHRGLALIAQRAGRPVGFAMRAAAPGETIRREQLARILERAGVSEADPDEPPGPDGRLPGITLAICTRNRARQLRRCLTRLEAVRTGISEILVIDNAPADECTSAVVSAFPAVRYICEPRPGLDFARNRALHEACGEFIAFVDDDACVHPHWFEGLGRALRRDANAAAITGPVLPCELATGAQVLFERNGGFGRSFRAARLNLGTRGILFPFRGIPGCGTNLVLRRADALHLGEFDEALDTGAALPGGGDLDILYRIVRAGLSIVYEPSMVVFHEHRRTFRELRRQMYTWGLGHMAHLTKQWHADPDQRHRAELAVLFWFAKEALKLAVGIGTLGCVPWKPGMIAAELAGGLVGLLGEYHRSLKRVRRIRTAFEGTDRRLPDGAGHREWSREAVS